MRSIGCCLRCGRRFLLRRRGDILFLTHSALLKALLCLVGETPFSAISTDYTLQNGAAMEIRREKILRKL